MTTKKKPVEQLYIHEDFTIHVEEEKFTLAIWAPREDQSLKVTSDSLKFQFEILPTMFPIRPDDLLFVQLSDVMRETAFILRSSNPLWSNSRGLLRQLSEQRTIFGRSFPQISRAWTMVTMPRRKEIARQKLMPRSPIPNSVRVRSASMHTGCLIQALHVHVL